MFKFVVKYFGFLKNVPLLPQLFDTQLLFWELITFSEIPGIIDDITADVLSWNGTTKTLHKYGGLQFNCNGIEFGHVHSNGLLDIRFNQVIKAALLEEGRIAHHHIFKNSGWISFQIRNEADGNYAIQLLRKAYCQIETGKNQVGQSVASATQTPGANLTP